MIHLPLLRPISILLLAGVCGASAAAPNIVFILADDLGWADVAFHGGNTPTPHLDRLVREGVELRQHYSAASCSPTRVGLLTGRCWSRFGVKSPTNARALPWDTITLAKALKSVGYDTALVGKWHLGSQPDCGPNHFGFDHSYGSLAGGVGPYSHRYKEGVDSRTWHRNHAFVAEEGHVTDLISQEAIAWLRGRGDAPFFLYVPFTAVHLPLQEPEEWLARVPAGIRGPVERQYAASIMHLDDAVGRILQALQETGKREDTVVVFTSDNGGTKVDNNDPKYPGGPYIAGRLPGNNDPLRGQKTELYEGGIRVPAIVSWPGKLRPRVVSSPVQIVDWMPTLSRLAGYQPARELKWDGTDIWPLISGATRAAAERTLYWTTPRATAVRRGDIKFILHHSPPNKAEKVELFDLARDPNETTDLAGKRPKEVAAFRQLMKALARADNDAAVSLQPATGSAKD